MRHSMTTRWIKGAAGGHTTKRASDRRHEDDDILRTDWGKRGTRFGSLAANMAYDEDEGGNGGGGDEMSPALFSVSSSRPSPATSPDGKVM